MTQKIKLGISSCLLGNVVRYDGGRKLDRFLRDTLERYVAWTPVCPEVECGLPVPREAMRLVRGPGGTRLLTVRTVIDYTGRMKRWSKKELLELEDTKLCGFVFKARSPSCGVRSVKVHGGPGGGSRRGPGMFAKAFMDRFPLVPIEDEDRLQEPELRENFIGRVVVYDRWQSMTAGRRAAGDLAAFHAKHRYLILAHSPKHLCELDALVSAGGKDPGKTLHEKYILLLMEGLRLAATARKHAVALRRVAGHLRDRLTHAEERRLREAIVRFEERRGTLTAVRGLIDRFASRHDEAFLRQHYYLAPQPIERVLRNRA